MGTLDKLLSEFNSLPEEEREKIKAETLLQLGRDEMLNKVAIKNK